jgi:[ribosomal protein S5]-alanine N-acetyltransferase
VDLASVVSERLELVLMSPEILSRILAGDRSAGERMAGVAFPDLWPNEHDERFLRMRLRQMTEDPSERPWLARMMALRQPDRPMIGHIGFHGKPDARGVVEIGYTVFEPHRRRGYAFEAVLALFDWACREHGITRFRASVGPQNQPSLNLVRKLGMAQVGTQWDEEDGLELVFEVSRPRPGSGPRAG